MGIDFFELALAKRGVGSGGGSSGGGGHGGGGDEGAWEALAKSILRRSASGVLEIDDLDNVGQYALSYCTGLTGASLPNCSSVGNSAFRNCEHLASVSVPKADLIASYSFANCFTLPKIEIGKGVSGAVTIEGSAFLNCYSLSEIWLFPDTVCTLGSTTALSNTPMESTSHTGSYGTIYVPANLVQAYKSASNWAFYSSRITAMP